MFGESNNKEDRNSLHDRETKEIREYRIWLREVRTIGMKWGGNRTKTAIIKSKPPSKHITPFRDHLVPIVRNISMKNSLRKKEYLADTTPL